MDYLSYKTFVWPHNPHTYKETYIREPKYVTENQVTTFAGMGDMKRIITGSGVFFGADAYTQFKKLIKIFGETKEPGNLEHPVWGIRYCYFTGLELTQEPKDDYVSYKFEFTGAQNNGNIPK